MSLDGREIPPQGFILDEGVNWYPQDHAGCLCVATFELVRST
jgi:hypothetical protein